MDLARASLLLVPALATSLGLAACDGEPTRLRGGRDAGGAATDAHTPPGVDAAAPMRIEVGPLPPDPMLDAIDRTRAASCPSSSRWVVAVRGRVVDERGAPIEGAFVQPCLLLGGTDRRVCLRPSTSDAQGVLTAMLGPAKSPNAPGRGRLHDRARFAMLWLSRGQFFSGHARTPHP